MATALPERRDIAKEHTWASESVYASDADMEAALQSVLERLPDLGRFQGRLAEGPETLARCLGLVEALGLDVGKIYTYALTRFSVDTGDQAAAALEDQANGLFARFQAAQSFIEPELLAIGADTLLRWVEEAAAGAGPGIGSGAGSGAALESDSGVGPGRGAALESDSGVGPGRGAALESDSGVGPGRGAALESDSGVGPGRGAALESDSGVGPGRGAALESDSGVGSGRGASSEVGSRFGQGSAPDDGSSVGSGSGSGSAAGQEPVADLAVYRHYFEALGRRAQHVRSAEVEELLGLIMDPFHTASSVHGVIADADMRFEDAVDSEGNRHALGQGNAESLWHSADRELRRTAWENYADAHLALKNGLANALASGIKQHVFMSRARRYDSALDAALSSSHIPEEVFHNLIETYRKHLPTWHRYWRVRKKALNLDKLRVYDTRAVLTEREPKVTYEQAVEWICEGMRPLGDEYVEAMRRGCLEERWVDRYPNKGKRSGAFSAGAPGTYPFILMSYTNDLGSMSTLAHELGHSMHSYYTHKTQPPVYSWYGIFVAEVASNFNQAMVRHHLFNTNDDPDFQIALIEEAMGNFHRYFFIMPTLARFEWEMHRRAEQGQPLTADVMNSRLADLFAEGYGDEVEYGDELGRQRVGITWAQFQHLYAPFYVYQYATGISGAHALANRVLAGEAGAAEAYLEFLKSGSSDYPLNVLRRAGVDLASPEPVEETFGVLGQLVDRLEALVDARAETSGRLAD